MGAEQVVIVVSIFACYFWWWIAIISLKKSLGAKIDNKDPRRVYQEVQGYSKRARNAMENHQEQFGFFAVAAILNLVLRGSNMTDGAGRAAAALSVFHSFMRMLHLVFYITDLDQQRTMVFFFGTLSLYSLYGLAIAAAAAM
eukprot:TRINITY_DN5233_c0_g1_i1.p1 TRINITY_DN5233_c0_g1~~TRINITY_DN5233_c0_g1_i1.p1  ORF type:complete len:142 (+),score=39.54 TRINITY_DN5233_c0_g1_i1:241-666(+)